MARDETKSVTFRLPVDIKEQLDASAALGDRTLSAEMIHRLRQSVNPAPADPLMTHSLARIVATALVETERRCGSSAWRDTATAQECRRAINVVFDLLLTVTRPNSLEAGAVDYVEIALAALGGSVSDQALAGAVADADAGGVEEAAYFARRLLELRPREQASQPKTETALRDDDR